jgi:glucosylceramidase
MRLFSLSDLWKQQLGVTPGLLLIVSFLFDASAFDKAKLRTSTQSAPWAAEQSLTVENARTVATSIEVDTSVKYQTVEYFGGCFNELGWRALQSLPPAMADSAIGSLFDTVNGCKFNMCRMPIGASDYGLNWYSLDETANDTLITKISIERDKEYLNKYIKAAMAFRPSLTIWACPWSPPSWMKTNNNYPGANSNFKQQASYLRAYALYFAKAINLYRDDGIKITALSFQNEPYSASSYPGCLWNAGQMRDFIKLYLGPKFDADKVDAEIWMPTMNNGDTNNFKTMLGDAECAKYIKAACFQWEGKLAVAGIHKSFPAVRILQTENECGDATNTWAYAENPTFYYMKYYFDNGACGYFQWNMILDNGGRSTWNWAQNAMISIDTVQKRIRYNPQYYAVKHFSYFVALGAKKIKTSGTYSNQVAFLNPDGSVIVVIGNTTTSPVSLGIKIDGSMTTATIPARSFSTVVFANTVETTRQDGRTERFATATTARVIKTGDGLTFARKGTSFSARLLGLNGCVVKQARPVAGNSVVISTQGLHRGMYVLEREIDGKKFCERVTLDR